MSSSRSRGRGPEFCLGLSDLDEADGPIEGKRVLVTGNGDRAMARAAGDARRVMDQSAGDSLAATPWVDEQVFKVWLTIRTSGQRGEARVVIAAVHDGDCHSGATLGDPVAGEHQVLRTSQQCRRVPGVRQRGRPKHPLQLGQIRFNRSTDDRPVAAGVTSHHDSPLRATTQNKRIPLTRVPSMPQRVSERRQRVSERRGLVAEVAA